VLGVLRLEQRLARNPRMLATLGSGIEQVRRQMDHFGIAHPTVQGRLAELYVETLSQLRPRVIVHGNPVHLSSNPVVEQIRALLLAAVRAAVLWRQVGGGQIRLLLRRREYAMLARGLLSRSTLDRG
jgi:high frequency lysogenization protein